MNKANLHIRIYTYCFVLFAFFYSFKLQAQIPGTCFEIESILVDGCAGSLEGQNEMVRFVVGNSALNTANLTVSWPNNAWQGICQNATTTAAVAQINNTIIRCGYLKEPTAGVLPAGAKVILVTSTAFNPLAQSFTNLSDTLYIIFQCAGNTAGHFGNFGTGTRTLTMAFSPPGACSDNVTYDRTLLTMQNGTFGAQDGGTVEFAWNGTPTYVNFGCQAPFIPLTVNAGPGSTICMGSASLSGTVTGTNIGVIWQGGSGTFSNPNSLSTTYTPSPTETGAIVLSLGVIQVCQDTIFDTLTVNINSPLAPTVAPASYCAGAAASALTATGSNLLWYTTATGGIGSSIAPTPSTAAPGTTNYYVSQTLAGCESARVMIPVTINALPNVNAGADIAIACGATSVQLNGSSSTVNATFGWTGPGIVSGSTSPSPTVNSAGTYILTVTGLNTCYADDIVIVSQSGSLAGNITLTPVTCFGANNGTATANVTAGTGPFSYSWMPGGQITQTINGLAPATYTVTISAPGTCSISYPAIITQPVVLAASTSVTEVSCFGGNNGASAVTPTGGITPYSYSWAPSGGINASATGLVAGNYTVTVTDSNSCTAMATSIIIQPAVSLDVTTSNLPAHCGNSDGTANSSATGGTSPYNYLWTPSGGTAANASALAAGSYSITVTDAHNCKDSSATSIINITGATLTISSTPVLCYGGNSGTASVVTAGGLAPFSYSWSPSGGTAANATGLSAGLYTVSVTDANTCVTTADTTVSQPLSALNASVSYTPVSCFGGNDGTATINASGGSTPYSYSWTPSGGTSNVATGLSAGNYTLTLTDANSCSTTADTTVTQPAQLTASTTLTAVSCFGGNNGTSTVTPTGGITPYSYSWAPSGGTNSSATGLVAGNYTVTLTDSNSCTAIATSIIIQPAVSLDVTTGNLPAYCGNSNGSANSIATGGTSPYNYLWTPSGGTATNANSLAAGTYTITVTDANGCLDSSATTIINITGATITIASTPVLCYGGNSGTASITPAGGLAPYSYSWAPSGGTSANATALSAGTYTVTVTDANNCVTIADTTVSQPLSALNASATFTPVSCYGGNDGTATASSSGGTTPYSYSWSPSGGTSNMATGLNSGNYTVTITDANNCSTTALTTVTQPSAALSATTSSAPVSCNGGNNGTATATPADGTPPYTYSWMPSGGTAALASGLIAATYTVTITDNNACTTQAIVTVSQPAMALTATQTNTPSHCNGNNGTATAVPSGGTAPYTYFWMPLGGTNANATGLPHSTYTVTITDANLCTFDVTTTIIDTGAITTTISTIPVKCYGETNGAITVNAVGGVPPYSYSWVSGETGPSISNLSAGSYHVYVTDTPGCTTDSIITLIDPPLFVADFYSTPTITDIYNPEIHFFAQTTNGNTWQWSFGDSTVSDTQNPIHTYSHEGTFPVTLISTDTHGCVSTAINEIIIQDVFTFYAPNAFTPNDDVKNEIFRPKGTGWDSKKYQLWVFDRWGNLCFNTSDTEKGWDGKKETGSEIAQVDVYVWRVQVSDIFGKQHKFIGTVTIVK